MYNHWNPWHGCTKISPGCKHCYVYRQDAMYGAEISSSEVKKNADFNLPIKRKRDKTFKVPSGTLLYTCMTSDFFVDKADDWRAEVWQMIKIRKDVQFFIFTKRIDRFQVQLPDDWGEGYEKSKRIFRFVFTTPAPNLGKTANSTVSAATIKFLRRERRG